MRDAERAEGLTTSTDTTLLLHCMRMLFYGLLEIADAISNLKGA